MKPSFSIGPVSAAQGEKASGFLQVVNTDIGMPLTVINGEREGKTILICGGIHNAEYVGIQAAMELADEIDPKEVAGNIVIVRLANRTGFEHRTMSLVFEDGKNLNRVFPGNAHGTIADRIAFTMEAEIFPKLDCFIDLHSGDGFEGLESYVYCLGNANDHVVETSRKMAEIAHVDYLVVSMTASGGAYNYAGSLGIPSILLERGGNSTWCRSLVEEDKHDVSNILKYLGILDGAPHRHGEVPVDVSPVTYEDAPEAGCWYPEKQPGETFREGEVLGRIKDYFGKELYICRAKHDGIILYETISLCIMKDSPMVAYGVWDEEKHGHIEKDCPVCGSHDHDRAHAYEHAHETHCGGIPESRPEVPLTD